MHEMCRVKSTGAWTSRETANLRSDLKHDCVLPDVENIGEENSVLLILIKFVNVNK